MFELYAKKNQLQLCKREPLTSGSVNVYRVVFGFSEDWEGLVRTAVFRAGEASASVLLEETGECAVPWEVLQKPGLRLEAGVYGTQGGEVVLPTVWADLGYICTGAAPAGELYPPTPELWRQELDRKGDGLGYTEEGKLGLWSGEKLLDAVPVDGISGPQGPQGEQGPTGQQGEPGAVGPKGEKGDRGETGPQGPQGIPGEQGPAGEAGPQGPQGDAGAPFSIAKTYPSIQAMNADYGGTDVSVGQFVMIDTGNVDDEDNAKLYVKGETAYNYITDLSGATGMTGPEGPRGLQGIAGPQGPQGQKGVQGVPGPQGPIGPTGPKGDKGDKGDVGPTGAAGATGAQGPTGPAGVGVPTGGSTGQMLVKASDSNFDTRWANQTILTRSFDIPDGGAGWYRIAKGQNVSAFVSICHAYSLVNGANILFYYSTYPWTTPALFVLGSRFDVNYPLTIDAIRICRDAGYMYYVDFHFSQANKEILHVSHLLCGGDPPKNQPPLAKVADAPDGETIELSVPISKNTPNGYI